MTTLPQTTTVRVPQQAAPGATPTGYVPIPSALAQSAGGFQMTGADVWRIIRSNLWLILLFVMVFGTAGYFLNGLLARKWPSYTAVATLQILTDRGRNPLVDQENTMVDARVAYEQKTQAYLLTQPGMFTELLTGQDEDARIAAEKVRGTAWFRSFANNIPKAKEYLRDNYRVSPVPDSTLLVATFKAGDAQSARDVLDALISRYLDSDEKRAVAQLDARLSSLRAMSRQLSSQQQQISARMIDKQANLTRKGFGGPGSFGSKETELKALVEAQLRLASLVTEARTQYERVQRQIKDGESLPEVDAALDQDPLVAGYSRQVQELEVTLMMRQDQMGKEHPEVKRIQLMIDLWNKKLADRKSEIAGRYSLQLEQRLRVAKEQAEANYQSVSRQVDTLKNELSDLMRDYTEYLSDQQTEKGLNELRLATDNKITEILTFYGPESQRRLTWAQNGRPELPDTMSFPKLGLTLTVALMVGLSLALGIAFLREMLNDTVRSPRDVQRVGQLNLLGMIAEEADDPEVADAKLAIFDAPHSLTAEQFRQVRTRLQHAVSLDTTRSLMVTGASPQDGKTTVAANVAAGLALNGRKILLVDANFRRPELHRLFGLPNEKGFSDVLAGTAAFDELIQASRIPNLSIMCSGSRPANATELLESQLLIDFIERALEEFDHVIFDTGPFPLVSESVALAPRVDGVITVVRSNAESRGLLQRMRDQLKQVKAEHIGVVLNAVRARGGGYYGRNIKTYYTYNNGD